MRELLELYQLQEALSGAGSHSRTLLPCLLSRKRAAQVTERVGGISRFVLNRPSFFAFLGHILCG